MDNKKVTKPKKPKPQRAAKPKQEKKTLGTSKTSKTPKTSKTSKTSKTLKKKSTKLKFENGDLELDEESYSKKVNILISKIKNKYLFDSDDSENKIRLGWK
jgi:glucan-binding YG repeat protein